MNNPIYLILNLSVLILVVKYIYDVRSERMLIIVLSLFGMACLGYLLTRTFHIPVFSNAGLITGFIVSPVLFSIYLLRQKGIGRERLIWRLMLIPTIIFFTMNMFRLLHLPMFGILYFIMILSVLIGAWVVIKKPGLKAILPFQVILIFLIIDTVTLLMK